MSQILRRVLIAVALLLSQQAAQLHGLSHLGRDLAVLKGGDKGAPPIGHPTEQCLAFHALDSALQNPAPAPELQFAAFPAVAYAAIPLPLPARIVFDSRAPPFLS